MAKPSSFLARLKKQVAESAQSRKGFWFVKEGSKRRIRFVRRSDLEDGVTIPWHTKWEGQRATVDSPCLEKYGKECPFCGVEGVRIRDRFAWTIYDYEQGEAQIFLFYANRASPIPHLTACYEEWGTLTDRDITIGRAGAGKDTVYTVTSGNQSKFRFEAKALSEAKILDMIWKAYGTGSLDDYPDAGDSDEEYDEDEEEYEEADEEEEESEEEEELDDEEEEELPRKAKKAAASQKKAAAGRRR